MVSTNKSTPRLPSNAFDGEAGAKQTRNAQTIEKSRQNRNDYAPQASHALVDARADTVTKARNERQRNIVLTIGARICAATTTFFHTHRV